MEAAASSAARTRRKLQAASTGACMRVIISPTQVSLAPPSSHLLPLAPARIHRFTTQEHVLARRGARGVYVPRNTAVENIPGRRSHEAARGTVSVVGSSGRFCVRPRADVGAAVLRNPYVRGDPQCHDYVSDGDQSPARSGVAASARAGRPRSRSPRDGPVLPGGGVFGADE